MKPAVLGLLLSFFGALPGVASLLPEDWAIQQLDEAGVSSEWYFNPGLGDDLRILVKGNSNNNSNPRRFLTGGPPDWISGPDIATPGLNKAGVYVSTGPDSGILVAPHLEGGTLRLKALVFNGGSVGVEGIDSGAYVTGGITGISVAVDSANRFHVAYSFNTTNAPANECIRYARRDGTNSWTVAKILGSATPPQARPELAIGVDIIGTAVIPPVAGSDVAAIYFTTLALHRMETVKQTGQPLALAQPSQPHPAANGLVTGSLAGFRSGAAERVFYFHLYDNGANSKKISLSRMDNGAGRQELQVVNPIGALQNPALPQRIMLASRPSGTGDAKPRIAWFDARARKVHYLKPNSSPGTDFPYVVGNPVALTGAHDSENLQGFRFGADDKPYLLLRRTYGNGTTDGFAAFPNDEFDMDGNGRAEIVDEALGSPKAVIQCLPLGAVVSGSALLPAGRFKFLFPTSGSSAPGVAKLDSPGKNLRIEVEVSTNATTWTKLTAFNSVTFTQTAVTGTNPNQIRTYAAVLPEPAPGDLSKRFARLIVTRINYPY
ncbi:hypothetical protein [Luteolibacter sp. Populi]|uniref:hypothetical protein n=1 Tax=Luteolibacter sp. Populi TaxID=3230487 RepID=UPI003466D565